MWSLEDAHVQIKFFTFCWSIQTTSYMSTLMDFLAMWSLGYPSFLNMLIPARHSLCIRWFVPFGLFARCDSSKVCLSRKHEVMPHTKFATNQDSSKKLSGENHWKIKNWTKKIVFVILWFHLKACICTILFLPWYKADGNYCMENWHGHQLNKGKLCNFKKQELWKQEYLIHWEH